MPELYDRISIVAIDPGRSKCGIATVIQDGIGRRQVERTVVPTERLVVTLSQLLRRFSDVHTIVIGAGTGSGTLVRAIKSALEDIELVLVDEKGTSLLARERYLADHPPSGWRRLLPHGLNVPSEPYDDYAALLLAERYLDQL